MKLSDIKLTKVETKDSPNITSRRMYFKTFYFNYGDNKYKIPIRLNEDGTPLYRPWKPGKYVTYFMEVVKNEPHPHWVGTRIGPESEETQGIIEELLKQEKALEVIKGVSPEAGETWWDILNT